MDDSAQDGNKVITTVGDAPVPPPSSPLPPGNAQAPVTSAAGKGTKNAAAVSSKVKEPSNFVQGKQKEKISATGGDKVPPVFGDLHKNFSESSQVAKQEGDEYWENYAREIELEKEILEMGGVEKVESGEVALPGEVAAEMGIRPATNIQTPMANVTNFTVRGVSLDDGQLSAGLVKPTSSGFRWLVEWFIYQLLKAHFVITKTKNKIIRKKEVGS